MQFGRLFVFSDLVERLRNQLPAKVDDWLGLTPDDASPPADATPAATWSARETAASRQSRWRPDPATLAIVPAVALRPPAEPPTADSLELHWIISTDTSDSATSLPAIVQLVRTLDARGHRQTLWIRPPWFTDDPLDALEGAIGEQPPWRSLRVAFLSEKVMHIEGDAVIATDWCSAYPAVAMPLLHARFLMVHDMDPGGHSSASARLLAHHSLTAGLKLLCAGDWLHQHLRATDAVWAQGWEDRPDPRCYFARPSLSGRAPHPRSERSPRPPRRHFVLHHHPGSLHWASELGVGALSLLLQQGIDFHVHFVGAPAPAGLPFPHTDHGDVSTAELGAIYRSCDLGLVLHTGDPSSTIRAMMLCGLPVATLDTPAVRHAFQGGTLIPVSSHPPTLAAELAAIDTMQLDAVTSRAETLLRNARDDHLPDFEQALLVGLGLADKPGNTPATDARLQRRRQGPLV